MNGQMQNVYICRVSKGQIGEVPIKVTCGGTLIKTTTEGAGAHSTVTPDDSCQVNGWIWKDSQAKSNGPLPLPLFGKDDGDEGPS